MPTKGHTEEAIFAALKQFEIGGEDGGYLPQAGDQPATFYLSKKQYAGLGVQELRELRQLRDENGRLLVAVTCSR